VSLVSGTRPCRASSVTVTAASRVDCEHSA
jgi:hypothetical protein